MTDIKQATGELEIRLNYARHIECGSVIISDRCAETVLEYVRKCEDKLTEYAEEIVKARNDGFDTVDYAIDKIRQARDETVRKTLEIVLRIALSDEYGAFVDEEIAREICNRAAEALGKEQTE
ncbi:MAG: hypothetical protein IJY01_00505 [Clostridia bacterium]|nr:hypothetical protein [Clostridia bacterium]